MRVVLVSCELLVLVIGISALTIPQDEQNRLIKLANIYYMDPVPSSRSPELRMSDVKEMKSKDSVKLIIHGYIASRDHAAVAPLRNAYLSKGFGGLLMADWRDASNLLYPTSRYMIQRVGARLAKILETFMRKQGISPNSIHIIGHSLGAHMAGVIGRYFNGSIGRVTGLDPARPLFQGNCQDCLGPDAARFVDVIHTDFPVFGDITPRGHADFYPNDGYAPQPGCSLGDLLTATSCSHYRAPLFFAESVRLPDNFPSVKCSLREIQRLNGQRCLNEKRGNREVVMMGDSLSKNVRGQFYLKTSYVPPYGLGAFSKNYLEYNNL